MLLTEKEARTICEKLLSYVKADDAVVGVGSENYGHLRFASNAFTTSGARENVNVGVTVWIGNKRGSASTNEIDDESLKATVALAEQLARISPVDREYMPTLGKQTYKPVNGYVEATSNISVTARAKTINDVITACEKSKVVGAGFHQARGSAGASATKNGNFIYEQSSLVSLATTARTPDSTSSGYFLRNHFDVGKLDTARVANEAIRKALEARNPQVLEPGAYPVILEPQAVADLLGFFAFSFDARSAEEGRSPMSLPGGKTKLGEKIFDERINVYSDPWHPELPGSQSAQAGLPAQKINSRTQWRAGESRLLALLGQTKRQRADARTSKQHHGKLTAARRNRRHDQVDGSRFTAWSFLVHPQRRSTHRVTNRSYARRHLVYRERQDPISGQEFPLQSKLDGTTCTGQRRHDWQTGTSRQL